MSYFFQPQQADKRRSRQLAVQKSGQRNRSIIHAGLLAAILFGLSLVSFISSPATHASGGSYINWDSTMIYPGQNNGNPLGPVGEPSAVHGLLLGSPNTQLNLVLVPGDATLDITTCTVGQIALGTVTTDASGQFDFSFKWPISASSGSYSICALDATSHTPVINQDGGPYSVLSPAPPTLIQDSNKVNPGGAVTISGENWLPPQPITVRIAKCAACGAPGTTIAVLDTASTGSNGSFSVSLTIPTGTNLGNYVIDAISKRGNPLDAYYMSGPLSLKVEAAPVVPAVTATPTAAITPTATPTAVKTPLATPTTATNTTQISQTNDTNANGSFLTLPILIGGFAALLLLIVIITGLIMWLRSGRRRHQYRPGPNYPPAGFTNYPPVYSAPQPGPGNFPQNIAQPGGFAQNAMLPGVQPQAQPMAGPITPIITPSQNQATLRQTSNATVASPLSPPPGSNATVASGNAAPGAAGFCPACGLPYTSGTQFCGECGKSIASLSANPTRSENI